MRRIDNLRDYVLTAPSICSTTRAILVGYIDEIEREVKELRDREYRNGMEDGEMAAERDGWVRLPVDADGKPIHVGDVVMDADVREIVERVVQIRYTLETSSKAPTVLTSIITDASQLPQKPSSYRHHHAPTVEDVLREFAEGLGVPVADSYVAAAAVKLTLRGDE